MVQYNLQIQQQCLSSKYEVCGGIIKFSIYHMCILVDVAIFTKYGVEFLLLYNIVLRGYNEDLHRISPHH
mgnify:CR=1 FL=1